ncbi:MAG: AMP-binding protein, partial [Sedimentitalea sp.]|nr:AMP-binding protein [Sedimentitalea sp.]
MYDQNHLLGRLRAASLGREAEVFAHLPGGGTIRFGALFAGAERMAAALTASGVAPGDRVAAQVPKTVQAIELYLGTVLAGAVFLPLNSAYTDAELAYFLGDATPAVVVCDPARSKGIAAIAGTARVLTLDAEGQGSLRDLAEAQGGFAAAPRGRDDLAAILYTSGTTGRSKGAMLSHGNLASN